MTSQAHRHRLMGFKSDAYYGLSVQIMLGWRVSCNVMRVFTSPNNASKRKSAHNRPFDAQAFLDSAGVGRKVKQVKKAEVVYSQGDAARNVMYLKHGSLKLTVVNGAGKEAVVAILGPGD